MKQRTAEDLVTVRRVDLQAIIRGEGGSLPIVNKHQVLTAAGGFHETQEFPVAPPPPARAGEVPAPKEGGPRQSPGAGTVYNMLLSLRDQVHEIARSVRKQEETISALEKDSDYVRELRVFHSREGARLPSRLTDLVSIVDGLRSKTIASLESDVREARSTLASLLRTTREHANDLHSKDGPVASLERRVEDLFARLERGARALHPAAFPAQKGEDTPEGKKEAEVSRSDLGIKSVEVRENQPPSPVPEKKRTNSAERIRNNQKAHRERMRAFREESGVDTSRSTEKLVTLLQALSAAGLTIGQAWAKAKVGYKRFCSVKNAHNIEFRDGRRTRSKGK